VTQGTYDCVVIGGGPAGLSAAIYMGRFLRRVIVIDEGQGRSSYSQVNENYLGFPDGIPIRDLQDLGRKQAERFGAEFLSTRVDKLRRNGPDFVVTTPQSEIQSRTVILATGVTDIWPSVPNVEEYVGKSLFWCITCDGFRTIDKRVVLFGYDDDAATTACQFQLFTKQITFIAEPGDMKCCEEKLCAMRDHHIEILEASPEAIEGTPDKISAVRLKDGRRIEADVMFSLLGSTPNNQLARHVGAKLSFKGFVEVDEEGYTSVPGLFCAGDVSGMHTHQVACAVCEGAEAAQTANYYLYDRYQRNKGDENPVTLNEELTETNPKSKIQNPK
jgi:thioredoxin reductase (NADPH)